MPADSKNFTLFKGFEMEELSDEEMQERLRAADEKDRCEKCGVKRSEVGHLPDGLCKRCHPG